jgi:hypothetical protein
MLKSKAIAFALLMVTFITTFAYSQEKVENRQIMTLVGTVIKVDFVGNAVVVKTDNGQMALSVPDDAVITQGAEDIGLEDLLDNDPVTVQYYIPSPGKYVVVTIADNNLINE